MGYSCAGSSLGQFLLDFRYSDARFATLNLRYNGGFLNLLNPPMNQSDSSNSQYTVVARRYRPQSFSEMVGQNHIAHALSNAIKQNRVGHAYLFTGARGVGKTSSARIFAKCLNCETGPTDTPCNQCDICRSVSVGEDIDVLEIDGASNRGTDEIRQLRSNAIVRPSRAKFKIYIMEMR